MPLKCLLTTSNEQFEKKIKKALPFKITSKRIKYLVINLIKEEKNEYNENYRILLKEIEEDPK